METNFFLAGFSLTKWIKDWTGISAEVQSNVFSTLIIIIILWILKKIIFKLLFRFNQNVHVNYKTRNSVSYILFFIGFVLIGRIWFEGFHSLATYFGLLSAGVAIALKEPIVNLAGWVFIIFRRPFTVGDRIQLGNHSGDVIDIRLFEFLINEIGNWVDADQSTGRIIHIPNAKVFTETQANYTKGFGYIWNELPVLVTFESDWKKAKGILQEIVDNYSKGQEESVEKRLRKATEKYMIYYSKLTPKVYTDVRDCGVLLTVRYLCSPPKRRDSQEKIWEQILTQFAEHRNIDFAYPTIRYYDNRSEGKEAAPTVNKPIDL